MIRIPLFRRRTGSAGGQWKVEERGASLSLYSNSNLCYLIANTVPLTQRLATECQNVCSGQTVGICGLSKISSGKGIYSNKKNNSRKTGKGRGVSFGNITRRRFFYTTAQRTYIRGRKGQITTTSL